MIRALVLGAGGFIGHHLCTQLKGDGYGVVGVDIKEPEFEPSKADTFIIGDLRSQDVVDGLINRNGEFDEVYQLAADMGGAGFVFTGKNDAEIMLNSSQINLNVARNAKHTGKVFFSSSACVYPEHNQISEVCPITEESTAYPASPDSNYGWEKIYAERLYKAVNVCHGADVRMLRFHNVYGPRGTYQGGREKAPAAICRKVAQCPDGGVIELWGDGKQTRSFMYIDDCITGIRRLMGMDRNMVPHVPMNWGSSYMVSIDYLANLIIQISGKLGITVRYTGDGPVGVRGRTSDNTLCSRVLGMQPSITLRDGLQETYDWINELVNR